MAVRPSDKNVASLPPSQQPGLIGGHIRKFWRDRIAFLAEQAALGDVSYFRLGAQPVYFLNHPDHLRDLFVVHAHKFVKGRAVQRAKVLLGNSLLTNEGSEHLRQRRMIQPAFHRARIAEYARSMIDCAERTSGSWHEGQILDIDKAMMHLTLQIVGKTLFDAEVEDDADQIGVAMTTLVGGFNFLLIPYSEWLEKLPLPQSLRFKKARQTLDKVMYSIIDERRRSGEDKGDLLSMLLMAQDEEDGSGLTNEQVRDEAMTLFLAGHETTANALTWAWYLLSQNPQAQARLRDELDTVLDGRAPTFDDVAELKYTEAILAESMRLYPPAWAIGRKVIEEHEFQGYRVPVGSLILTSPYVTHRDKRFWDDADKFVPERWFEQSVKEAGARNIYFPFGGGVRKCIGDGFAWTEGILLIAAIARRWSLSMTDDQRVGLNPQITLRPKYGMRMKLSL